MKLKELFESKQCEVSVSFHFSYSFLTGDFLKKDEAWKEFTSRIVKEYPNTVCKYIAPGNSGAGINLTFTDAADIAKDEEKLERRKQFIEECSRRIYVGVSNYAMPASLEITGELNFTPLYKGSFKSVTVNIRKGDSLTSLGTYLHSSNLILKIENNWVGGVLSLFEIKGLQPTKTAVYTNDPKISKVFMIVLGNLKEGKDKWDCQEELEKDKSTKPFASE
jgi:hypothetical protein